MQRVLPPSAPSPWCVRFPGSVYTALSICHPRMLPDCLGSTDPEDQYHAPCSCNLHELRAEAKSCGAADAREFHLPYGQHTHSHAKKRKGYKPPGSLLLLWSLKGLRWPFLQGRAARHDRSCSPLTWL